MDLKYIRRYCHYKSASKGIACGFDTEVFDAQNNGEIQGVEFPILKVRKTTNICNVDCPDCVRWLSIIVDALKFKLGI